MALAPQMRAIRAQKLLIDFADPFQNLPYAIEIPQLLPDLRNLGGMEGDLAVFGARVVDIEDPLEVPSAAGTGGTGNR
jgi:hypothetical protein